MQRKRRGRRLMMIMMVVGSISGCIDIRAGQAQLRAMGYYDLPSSYSLTSCSSSCKRQKCHATCVTW